MILNAKPAIILSTFFATTSLAFAPITVEAESNVQTVQPTSAVSNLSQNAQANVLVTGTDTVTDSDMSEIDGSNYLPDTTMQEANTFVEEKGEDLVGLAGTAAKPIAEIGFMLGLFLTLVGGFSKSVHLGKGIAIMAISIFVYVGTVFAPDLIQYFSTWLAT